MEKVFSLKNYTRGIKNTKLKFFLNYIAAVRNTDSDVELLVNVDEDMVLESLEKYIPTNKVNTFGSARSYIGYIAGFYEDIFYDYGIKNELFFLKDRLKSLENDVISKIAYLPKSTDKEIALDTDIIRLNKLIEYTWHTREIDQIYREINELKYSGRQLTHLSCITCKLLITYGFKNNKIGKVQVTDYNKESKTLKFNNTLITLTQEIATMMEEYLEIRDYIVRTKKATDKHLFIDGSGSNLFDSKNTLAYGRFYKILSDSTIIPSAENIAYATIINMIRKGIDIITISEITGHSLTKCNYILDVYRRENLDIMEVFNKLEEELSIQIDLNHKNKMHCLHCGRSFDNITDNWVVVQYEDDSTNYIVCKECKGENEQNNIS